MLSGASVSYVLCLKFVGVKPEVRTVSYVFWFDDICCECLIVRGTQLVFLVQHTSGVSVSYALNLCFLYSICRECLLVMHSTCVFSTAYVALR